MPSRISLSEHTLKVNIRRCNLSQFDFREVEEYVHTLTGDREYQFEAIKQILIYLWGGAYKNLLDLAKENYRKKAEIQKRFQSEAHFLRMLPLPDRLSGVCHLATGTGKSYVMFAVAHLSLLLGKIERVLILGPSSTVIESGLREKFKEYLYGDKGAELKAKLPEKLRYKVIGLLNCNDPIEDSSIVIENINAIYTRARNSLGETLFNHGQEVLVLSDEVHHAYSHLTFSGETVGYAFQEGREGQGDTRDERLWMKYLREEPLIKRHIGFTGTPYNRNDYFPDVICNYSIKDASDERIIKKIDPILKTETDEGDGELTRSQRFQQILKTHAENRKKFAYPGRNGRPKVKPITIFIHPSQNSAEKNADEFVKIFADSLRLEDQSLANLPRSALEQIAREKVLCVISRLDEAEYRQKLSQVEEVDPEKIGGKVEFIFAVNKLSEGWDVDNVFQIVPAEERVFNSKLLISQVLGRGLRLPRKVNIADIHGNYPVVTVTNHDRFARHITELLDEVTQCELRFTSNVLTEPELSRSSHHFVLFNLEYLPSHRVEDRIPPEGGGNGGSRRELKLTPSAEKLGVKVIYRHGVRRFELSKDFFTVDQIVLDTERKFKNTVFETSRFDFGDGLGFDQVPGREEIERTIRSAMQKYGIEGDRLSLGNRQEIELFFNWFLPKGTKKVVRENIEGAVVGISTMDMEQKSCRSDGLDHEISAFLAEDYEQELADQNRFVLEQMQGNDRQLKLGDGMLSSQEEFNRDYIRQLVPFKHLYAVNTSLFRTSQDIVILSHEPERKFLYRLIEHGHLVSSWVKAPDKSFYTIEYEYWKGGKDRVRRSFNPDFFIKIGLSAYIRQLSLDPTSGTLKRMRDLQYKGIEELILVVEIKGDEDDSEETSAKASWAEEHFRSLNQRLREINPIDFQERFRSSVGQAYTFQVLHPNEYSSWFGKLRTGNIIFGVDIRGAE